MRTLLVDAVLALGVALVVVGVLTGNVFVAAGGVEPSATDLARIVLVGVLVFVGLRIARAARRRRA
jgi:hypothetical protein